MLGLALAVAIASSPVAAQSQAPAPTSRATNVADDPDVLGAERLFSAWMDGQIAYRGLPGIVVGVVSDQQLVWSKDLGLTPSVTLSPPLTTETLRDGATTADTYLQAITVRARQMLVEQAAAHPELLL